jgi:hypothetical protein
LSPEFGGVKLEYFEPMDRFFRKSNTDPMKTPAQVILYTRSGCHLCEDAEALLVRHGLAPRKVDIETDAALVERFGNCIPSSSVSGARRPRA